MTASDSLIERSGLPTAIADVAAERQRQISVEGWSPEHDDGHIAGQMALAAACYAVSGAVAEIDRGRHDSDRLLACIQFVWPKSWSWSWWKPKDRRSDLVRAAALIVAEIERLDRAKEASQ